MPLNPETLKKYLNPLFVETGTKHGHGIQAALTAGFEMVISIDNHLPFVNAARERFSADKRVWVISGESKTGLFQALAYRSSPATIFLDAHTLTKSPILDELEVIRNLSCKTNTILVDDMRLFRAGKYGITVEQVLSVIESINRNYEITYDRGFCKNDVMVARIS